MGNVVTKIKGNICTMKKISKKNKNFPLSNLKQQLYKEKFPFECISLCFVAKIIIYEKYFHIVA